MRSSSIFTTALLTLAVAVSSASAAPARVCLDVKNITDTDSKDGKTINFTMRDGSSRLNHLKAPCDGLIIGGFTWVINADNQVCEDSQTLRAIETGEICVLGKFDPAVKKTAAKS